MAGFNYENSVLCQSVSYMIILCSMSLRSYLNSLEA